MFLDVSQETTTGSFHLRQASNVEILGQGWKPTISGDCPKISLLSEINPVYTPDGDVWITIETNNVDVPSGNVLATSVKIDASTIPDVADWIDFIFNSPPTLTAGTLYWIVLHGDYDIDANKYVEWGTAGDVYDDGTAAHYDGGWLAAPTSDTAFRTYCIFNIEDSLSISESISRDVTYHLSLSDSIDIKIDGQVIDYCSPDSVRTSKFGTFKYGQGIYGQNIRICTSMSIAEDLVKTIGLTLSDDIAIIDTEIKNTVKILSDTHSIAESLAKEVKLLSLTDSQSISENLANKSTLRVSDTQIISEDLATESVIERSLSDAHIISEIPTFSVIRPLSDSHSITEDMITGAGKALSDIITFADSEIETPVLNLSDNQSISEVIVNSFTKAITDDITFADSEIEEPMKNLSDSQSISENLVTISEIYRSLSDSVTFDDGTGKDVAISLSDSILITEAVSLEVQPNLSDLISFAEEISSISVGLLPTDVISLSEALVNSPTLAKTDSVIIEGYITGNGIVINLSDTQSIAESIETATSLGASLSDSLSISEALVTSIIKNISDTFDLFEEIGKSIGVPLAESLAIAEAVGNSTTLSLSDEISIAESIIGINNLKFDDNISISEDLFKDIAKPLDDSISIAETTQKSLTVPFTESVPISEQVGNSAGLALSDDISISESSVTVKEFYRTPSDNQSISEAEAKVISKVLTDLITFSESEVSKKVEHFEDSLQTAEEISNRAVIKNITDSLSIADGEAKGYTLELTDSITISEGLVRVVAFQPNLGDSVAFVEDNVFDIVVNKAESLPIAETLANVTTLSLSDSINITESETESSGKAGLTDSIGISETFTSKQVGKGLDDNLSIAESMARVTTFHLTFEESMAIDESIVKAVGLPKADSITFAESLTSGWVSKPEDSLSISESLSRIVEYYRELSENVVLSDSPESVIHQALTDAVSFSESSSKDIAIALTDSESMAEELTTSIQPTERLKQQAFLRTNYW